MHHQSIPHQFISHQLIIHPYQSIHCALHQKQNRTEAEFDRGACLAMEFGSWWAVPVQGAGAGCGWYRLVVGVEAAAGPEPAVGRSRVAGAVAAIWEDR
uniref:Uncharacterized protein n=1 Tax=Aegilops tauschii subsp. strangulata TaxID=200361 RepID=A0A453DNW9_AEGTS